MIQLLDRGILPLAADLADAVLRAVGLVRGLLVHNPVAPVVALCRDAHQMHIPAPAADIILRARLRAVCFSAFSGLSS